MSESTEVNLILFAPPFSINKLYFNRPDNKKIRSTDARNWGRVIFTQLSEPYNQHQLNLFRSKFDAASMGITIDITVYYPKSTLFTKTGHINSKSIDITNHEKPLVDLIFDPKFAKRELPEGCPNLELNDKYILDCYSRKRYTDSEPYISVKLKTILLETL